MTLGGTLLPSGFGLLQSEDLSKSNIDRNDPSVERLLDGIASVVGGQNTRKLSSAD